LYTETLVLFLAVAFAITLAPGADMLYVVSRGVGQGRTAALVSAAAVNTGSVVHLLFAVAGLSVLLQQSAVAFYAIKYAGAAYLVYLGVKIVLDRDRLKLSEGEASRGRLVGVFAQGVATNLLNPKAYLFFLSFLPQFVDPSVGQGPLGSVAAQMLLLGFLFVAVGVVCDGLIAWFSGGLGELLASRPRFSACVRWLAGGILLTLGLRLAVPEPR
jgi:threonine/homoserine/homoserine lactone efflux protein